MGYLKEINENFPIRKTNEQKENFTKYLIKEMKKKGINAKVETLGKNKNVVVGNPLKAKVIFTAHYDTPCASIFPNLMLPLNKVLFFCYQFIPIILSIIIAIIPAIVIGKNILDSDVAYIGIFLAIYFSLFLLMFKAFTNKRNVNDNTSGTVTLLEIIDKLSVAQLQDVAFIFFDNEEKGLLGSKAFAKANKQELKDKLLINFDCVGNGKQILFIAKEKAQKNPFYNYLKKSFVENEEFLVSYHSAKESVANSDHKKFEQGVCCVACKKSKRGILYTPYIHTGRDVVADSKNIEFLAESTRLFVEKLG